MKVTSILILFNVIIFLFLGFVFMAPLFILGFEEGRYFWLHVWPLTLLLVLLLTGLDICYLLNRRLFLLLEKEDWPALIQYLEGRIFRKGRYFSPLVRLLANTYLVLSDSASVIALENKAHIAKPETVEKNALIFGAARILSKNYSAAIRFFAERLEHDKGKDPQKRCWLQWYHGFALLLEAQYAPAAEIFKTLAQTCKDALVTGLAAFFLGERTAVYLPGQTYLLNNLAAGGRERVRKALPSRAAWDKELSKVQTEVHAAILSRFLQETSGWLYGGNSQ